MTLQLVVTIKQTIYFQVTCIHYLILCPPLTRLLLLQFHSAKHSSPAVKKAGTADIVADAGSTLNHRDRCWIQWQGSVHLLSCYHAPSTTTAPTSAIDASSAALTAVSRAPVLLLLKSAALLSKLSLSDVIILVLQWMELRRRAVSFSTSSPSSMINSSSTTPLSIPQTDGFTSLEFNPVSSP